LNQKHLKGIEKEAMKKLMEYHWPGNVRELENVIHRAVLLAKSDLIRSEEIILEEIGFNGDHLSPRNLKELEKALILETLRKVNWNKAKAAKLLGITARTIRNKLKEYGIDNGSREKGGKDGAF
jgi:two-component system response regulator AtoC